MGKMKIEHSETMKLSASIVELGRVGVIGLSYKDTENKNVKEVVYTAFFSDEINFTRDRAISLSPTSDKGEKVEFVVKDFEKEYSHQVINEGKDTYLHIIKRNPVKSRVVVNESLKRAVSILEPIVFINEENPTFEEKRNLYQIGRSFTKNAYIPNMFDSSILSKHIDSDDIDETEAIIEDILNGGVNKKSFHSRKYNLAEYYIGIYKKWVDFYFDIVLDKGLIKKAKIRISNMKLVPYFVQHSDDVIEPYLQAAIRSGELAFTKNKKPISGKIIDNSDYTRKYAVAQAMQMNNISKPLHKNGEIRQEVSDLLEEISDRKLFAGQVNAIDAMLKALDHKRNANNVGEMGIGKSTIMYLTALAHSKLKLVKGKHQPMKLFMFEPDHLVNTMQQEILDISSGRVKSFIVKDLGELIALEKQGIFEDEKDYVVIVGQGSAKRKFTFAPYPAYNINKKEFSCPDCGEVIKKRVKVYDKYLDKNVWVEKPVNHLFFSTKKPTNTNKCCKHCGEKFWAIESSKVKSNVFYSKAYGGFVAKDEAALELHIRILESEYSSTESKRKSTIKNKITQARKALDELRGVEKVVRRISHEAAIAHYVFKKMRYKFTHLIADEIHEFQGNSLRYEACKWLVKSIRYTITGTGTAMNGYAHSRFRTDFLLNPATMIEHGYSHNDSERFQEDFGVVERRYRVKEMMDGVVKKLALRPKNKPSINPAIFTKFMQDSCVFVTMDDMGADMPDLEYIPMPVEVDPLLRSMYEAFIDEVKKKTAGKRDNFLSIFQTSNLFLDAPQKEHLIYDKKTNEALVKSPIVTGATDRKLQKLIEVAHDRINTQGKNMLVYVHFKAGGIKDYLRTHLQNEGFNVAILNSNNEYSIEFDGTLTKVAKEEREFWIRKQASLGANIVICNPTLVQTGCNLIEFPIIVNYQLSYHTYVIRQADRRAWRLTQKEKCEVINIFYADTIQSQVASIMATKIVASRSIEGNLDSDGLESMCDTRTAEEEMVAEFYAGLVNALEAAAS